MLMGCVCMFLFTYKRIIDVTKMKNKRWDFGWRGFLWEELLYLFYIDGTNSGGSAWLMPR